MKTAKENQGAGSVDVDALLAAINEISESEVQRTQDDHGSQPLNSERKKSRLAGVGMKLANARST